MKKEVLNDFYDVFAVGQIVRKDEIRQFLEKYYGEMKKTTLTWRIYDLKNEGYIKTIDRKSFEIIDKNLYIEFTTEVNEKILKLLKKYNSRIKTVKKLYPEEQNFNISVWNTGVLNKYTTHQVYKNINIVEIDKLRITNLFFYIKPKINSIVIIKNTQGVEYLLEDDSIYISNLPMKSPIQKKQSSRNNYVGNPKAEKVLVDLFIYNKSILPYDDQEIENIYKNIYKKHIVKTKTVLNYARIRGKKTRSLVEDMLKRIGEL